jgi:hypothetical protein
MAKIKKIIVIVYLIWGELGFEFRASYLQIRHATA